MRELRSKFDLFEQGKNLFQIGSYQSYSFEHTVPNGSLQNNDDTNLQLHLQRKVSILSMKLSIAGIDQPYGIEIGSMSLGFLDWDGSPIKFNSIDIVAPIINGDLRYTGNESFITLDSKDGWTAPTTFGEFFNPEQIIIEHVLTQLNQVTAAATKVTYRLEFVYLDQSNF